MDEKTIIERTIDDGLVDLLMINLKLNRDEAIKMSWLEIDFHYLFSGTFTEDAKKMAIPYFNEFNNLINDFSKKKDDYQKENAS